MPETPHACRRNGSPRRAGERFDRLVHAIYDCARDPAGWSKALSALCVLVNASGGLIARHSPADGIASPEHVFNVAPRFHAAFAESFGAAGGLPRSSAPGRVLTTCDFDPGCGPANTAFQAGFLGPQGFQEGLYGFITAPGGGIRIVALLRRTQSPAFEPRDKAVLERALPHLALAQDLRREIDGARADLSHFLDILNDLPLACLIVERGARVRYGNACAHALLGPGRALVSVAGRLATANAAETRELHLAIERIATATTRDDGFMCHHIVVRQAPDGEPLLLHLRPVRGHGASAAPRPSGLVAVICKGRPDPREDPMRDFARAYSLTGSEAHLVSLLAEGCDLIQAAERLGVTKNTARTHMRRVYSKVDAHRQVDLMRLIGHLRLS